MIWPLVEPYDLTSGWSLWIDFWLIPMVRYMVNPYGLNSGWLLCTVLTSGWPLRIYVPLVGPYGLTSGWPSWFDFWLTPMVLPLVYLYDLTSGWPLWFDLRLTTTIWPIVHRYDLTSGRPPMVWSGWPQVVRPSSPATSVTSVHTRSGTERILTQLSRFK